MTDEDLLAEAIGESASRLRDLVGLSEAEIQAAMAGTTLLSSPIWDSMYCDTYLRGKRTYWLAVQRLPWPRNAGMDAEIARLDGLLVELYNVVIRAQ